MVQLPVLKIAEYLITKPRVTQFAFQQWTDAYLSWRGDDFVGWYTDPLSGQPCSKVTVRAPCGFHSR
jgi:hypothetical protein